MLLDQLFNQLYQLREIVIVRKDGEIKYETRPVEQQSKEHEFSDKELFPISKDRS